MTSQEKQEPTENSSQKPVKYEFAEEKPAMVEEPFVKYPALNLDITKRYTYADYLTWMDEKRRELIDGIIHLFSAPARIHARITGKLYVDIENYVRKNRGKCHVYDAPFDVRFPVEGSKDHDKIYNVVQPDICVICDLSKLDEKGCIGAPDMIVEVLSPATAKYDWNYKFNLYEKTGVREYWIVNPKTKVINAFIMQPNGMYDLGTEYEYPQKVPVHIFEGLEIDLEELFED